METIKQLLIICLFLFVAILLFNFYLGYKKGDKSSVKKSVEPRSLGLLGVLDPKDASDLTRRGRERKPSKNWICTRCGADFVLPVDAETIPIPWWYGEATKSFTTKNPAPWACPNCGTHAYTVPA